MTINKQALREELSNPAIGTNAHLRKLALALLDELEASGKLIDTLRQDKDKVIDMSIERVNKLLSRAEAAEKRIAELEARELKIKQFDEFAICHFGASEDYAKGYIDCQKNYNKALGAANILVSLEG